METMILVTTLRGKFNIPRCLKVPSARRRFLEISDLQSCEYTGRERRGELVVHRPDRRSRRDILDLRHFIDIRNKPYEIAMSRLFCDIRFKRTLSR